MVYLYCEKEEREPFALLFIIHRNFNPD